MVLSTLLFRNKKHQQTCYFCRNVDLTTYSGICTWHRCKISLRLFLLLLRTRRILRIWRIVRWGL